MSKNLFQQLETAAMQGRIKAGLKLTNQLNYKLVEEDQMLIICLLQIKFRENMLIIKQNKF